ncbi:MAG: NifU family protein, partial [Acidimicrobiia bacterium]
MADTDSTTDTLPSPEALEAGVLAAIDAIRPALQSDGGDIVFNEIDADYVVHVS